jgi:hypothetical protein
MALPPATSAASRRSRAAHRSGAPYDRTSRLRPWGGQGRMASLRAERHFRKTAEQMRTVAWRTTRRRNAPIADFLGWIAKALTGGEHRSSSSQAGQTVLSIRVELNEGVTKCVTFLPRSSSAQSVCPRRPLCQRSAPIPFRCPNRTH